MNDSGGLPPEMFTKDAVTPPDALYEELAAEFPAYVRRNANGEWEIDIWKAPGLFSPAIKAFHARSAHGTTSGTNLSESTNNQDA